MFLPICHEMYEMLIRKGDIMQGKIYKILMVFFMIVVMAPTAALAEPTVVVCEGKYVMGDLDSKKDAKSLALMEAKRMAMEKAGTYLESSTEVRDFTLSKDQIQSLTAGVMSVEVLDEKWSMSGENMVVVVRVKATVDASHLKDRIKALQESHASDGYKEIQTQMAALQKELAELKTQQSTREGEAREKPKKEVQKKHEAIIQQMSALEYLQAGDKATMAQRWKEAEKAFNQAIAADPRLVEAYTGKAFALAKMKREKEALETINRAIDINPVSPRALAVKAMILKDQPGRTEEALSVINNALKLQPGNGRLYLFRGEIYVKLRNRALAEENFRKACTSGVARACERLKMRQDRMDDKPRRDVRTPGTDRDGDKKPVQRPPRTDRQ